MQLPSQGQWWSYFSTQWPQKLQWETRAGRRITQVLQYFSFCSRPLFVSSTNLAWKNVDRTGLFWRTFSMGVKLLLLLLVINPGSEVTTFMNKQKLSKKSSPLRTPVQACSEKNSAALTKNTIPGIIISAKVNRILNKSELLLNYLGFFLNLFQQFAFSTFK